MLHLQGSARCRLKRHACRRHVLSWRQRESGSAVLWLISALRCVVFAKQHEQRTAEGRAIARLWPPLRKIVSVATDNATSQVKMSITSTL